MILVTGAAGFIGQRLCARLLDDGHEVTGVDCHLGASYDPAVKRAAMASLRARRRFTFVERDLRTDQLGDLVAVDAVIHLAAMPGLRLGPEADEVYESCNIAATRRLLEAATATAPRAKGPRFIHASTSSVYGEYVDGDETQPTRPISTYGRSKLAAERQMQAAGAVVLRYFSVYGPGQRPDMAYHRFCEAMLDGRPIMIHGDGRQVRANTYVDDVVAATVAAVERGKPGETYNIGGATPIRLLDAVAILAEACEANPTLAHAPVRRGDQRATRADTAKAARDLGWVPTTDPIDGLRQQVAWHRSRRLARRGHMSAA
jgi:nucleoside-diphosphate-sugar epimerase